MDLRAFVKSALMDIVHGVEDAQRELPCDTVVPRVIKNFRAIETGISEVQVVEFVVSVQAGEGRGSEAKLNVVAAFVGGGVKGNSTSNERQASTLKFKIPVRLPAAIK